METVKMGDDLMKNIKVAYVTKIKGQRYGYDDKNKFIFYFMTNRVLLVTRNKIKNTQKFMDHSI
jgi:hypothetical protein